MANGPSRVQTWLLIVSDREPLAWMLRESRFAVPAGTRRVPDPGDEVLVYTTRGCYRNPTRDRGVVMGRATVTTPPRPLPGPVSFRGRDFTTGFGLDITGLAPLHEGVELRPLAGRLDFLPDPATWSVRMRRTLIALRDADARTLATSLKPFLRDPDEVLDDYVRAARLTQ